MSWMDFDGDGKMDILEELFVMDMVCDSGQDEIEMAGLDRTDLEFMDEEERQQTLEDAGLDPDDYDF